MEKPRNQALTFKGYPKISKMINAHSPPPPLPSESILVTKLNDGNIDYMYNLRNLETDLALQRVNSNFLKHSSKYSGAML